MSNELPKWYGSSRGKWYFPSETGMIVPFDFPEGLMKEDESGVIDWYHFIFNCTKEGILLPIYGGRKLIWKGWDN